MTADKVDYVINGTTVHSTPKASAPKTDGVYGFRVNHPLEVLVTGFAKSEQLVHRSTDPHPVHRRSSHGGCLTVLRRDAPSNPSEFLTVPRVNRKD